MQRCLSPMPVFDAGAGREEKAAQEKRDDMRSRQNSAVVRQIVVDKIQKTNDDSRRIWNAAVCRELGVPDTYEKVAVLLVHWDGPFDRDGECAGEVGWIIVTWNISLVDLLTLRFQTDGEAWKGLSRALWIRNQDRVAKVPFEEA